MRMVDLILKKRNGGELTKDEIEFMIQGFCVGAIPDYQMSAMLMAIYFKGMTAGETLAMTNAVVASGDTVDLSGIEGIKVDKHSTGGVGDKTTLIVAPIVASCGVKVAKMSGRGLGHTGGTVDKMESIPGLKTALSQEDFFETVNKAGLSVIGQTGNLAPADKKLYALRDVTATVDSIPLIAVSIMSKKLAAGSDCIVLDIKTGSGAFMKTLDDAIALAEEMVAIGENAGKRMVALITDMDIPLGHNIGNALEVIEAIETLKGEGPEDLTQVCLALASNMLYVANKGTMEQCKKMAQEAIASGKALTSLKQMVKYQGGDETYIDHPEKFPQSPYQQEVCSTQAGYITHMDTEACGIASALLGAGRETMDSPLDYTAGIVLHKKVGDMVAIGERLATLYTSDESKLGAATQKFLSAFTFSDTNIQKEPLIFARIEKGQMERYAKE